MADSPWITVSFTPATKPMSLQTLVSPDSPATQAQELSGWCLQHRYGTAGPTTSTSPTDSRVVPAVLDPATGQQIPVAQDKPGWIGVYPGDKRPRPEDIDEAAKKWRDRPDKPAPPVETDTPQPN